MPVSLSELRSDMTAPIPFNETAFQSWYQERAAKLGLNLNPDDPRHFYDYRAAYRAGAEPDSTGHWPSQFKLEGHPRTYLSINGVMTDTRTGQPAISSGPELQSNATANVPVRLSDVKRGRGVRLSEVKTGRQATERNGPIYLPQFDTGVNPETIARPIRYPEPVASQIRASTEREYGKPGTVPKVNVPIVRTLTDMGKDVARFFEKLPDYIPVGPTPRAPSDTMTLGEFTEGLQRALTPTPNPEGSIGKMALNLAKGGGAMLGSTPEFFISQLPTLIVKTPIPGEKGLGEAGKQMLTDTARVFKHAYLRQLRPEKFKEWMATPEGQETERMINEEPLRPLMAPLLFSGLVRKLGKVGEGLQFEAVKRAPMLKTGLSREPTTAKPPVPTTDRGVSLEVPTVEKPDLTLEMPKMAPPRLTPEKAGIIKSITQAESNLAKQKVDNYNVRPRVLKGREKYLGNVDLNKAPDDKLKTYLIRLQEKQRLSAQQTAMEIPKAQPGARPAEPKLNVMPLTKETPETMSAKQDLSGIPPVPQVEKPSPAVAKPEIAPQGYREVGTNEVLPAGSEIKMDMATGKNYVKESKAVPPVVEKPILQTPEKIAPEIETWISGLGSRRRDAIREFIRTGDKDMALRAWKDAESGLYGGDKRAESTVNSVIEEYQNRLAESKPVSEIAKPIERMAEQPTAYKEVSGIYEVPLRDIRADVDRFQNRASEYSGETVQRIVDKFDPDKLRQNPIVLWKDPKTGGNFVLAGHSRIEGMKRLGMETIPAIFRGGTEEQARDFALIESNRLTTKETLAESVKAYKRAIGRGYNKGELKNLFGSDTNTLEAIQHLDPRGKFIDILNQPASSSFPYVKRFATWVGQLRGEYGNKLTNIHESQLFDFLYKEKRADYAGYLDKLTKDEFFNLVRKNVDRFDWNPNQPLVLKRGEVPLTGTRARRDTGWIEEKVDELLNRRQEAMTVAEVEAINKEIAKLRTGISEIAKKQGDIFGSEAGQIRIPDIPFGEIAKKMKRVVTIDDLLARPSVVLRRTPAGRRMIDFVADAETTERILRGKAEKVMDDAIGKLTKPDRRWIKENFKLAYEQGQSMPNERIEGFSQAWGRTAAMFAQFAKRQGLKYVSSDRGFNEVGNYFPHVLTDKARLAFEAKSGKLYEAISADLEKKGQKTKGIQEILVDLSPEQEAVVVKRSGSLENPRLLDLPETIEIDGRKVDVLRKDPFDVIPGYIIGSSRRLGIIESFGQGETTIRSILELAGDDVDARNAIRDAWTNIQKLRPAPKLSQSRAGAVVRPIENVVRAGLLSLGQLANVPGYIAIVYKAGLKNSIKAFAKSFTNDPQFEIDRGLGAWSKDTLRDLATTEDLSGKSGKFSRQAMKAYGFEGINRHLNKAGARAISYTVDDVLKILRKNDVTLLERITGRSKEAIVRSLQRDFFWTDEDIHRIIKNGLTERDRARVVQRAPALINVMGESALDRPAWMRHPIAQRFLAYSSFARAMGNIFADTVREARKGNLYPLAVFLVGQQAAGEIEIWLKNFVTNKQRTDKGWFDRLINNYLASMTFGLWGLVYEKLMYRNNPIESMAPPNIEVVNDLYMNISSAIAKGDLKRGIKGALRPIPIVAGIAGTTKRIMAPKLAAESRKERTQDILGPYYNELYRKAMQKKDKEGMRLIMAEAKRRGVLINPNAILAKQVAEIKRKNEKLNVFDIMGSK